MAREKTTGFYFKMSPEELNYFEKRMEQTGIKNKSAFIRKMCIDGHVIQLDLPTLKEIQRQLSITSNNFNQIAKRVNGGGDAYPDEIASLNDNLTAIRSDFGKVLEFLSELATAKPGKRFIPPLTVRDLPEYSSHPAEHEGA